MSDMPPPPPRPPGRGGGDLLRRAVAGAAAGLPGHPPPPGAAALPGLDDASAADSAHLAPPPRDPGLPLPLPWTDYFDRREVVACPAWGARFNVYLAGDHGPVVLCLHGGGYTGLSWALIAKRLKDKHRVVAPDLRCHGLTQAEDCSDFSAATLAADVVALWQAMFGGGGAGAAGGTAPGGGSSSSAEGGRLPAEQAAGQAGQQAGAGGGPPPTVLVGHSMGGAIAVHAAATGGIASLAGIVVIDVVEGTALASLPYMSTVLEKRPRRFASLAQAVDWALDTGMCKRQEAAHVSLPAMLRPAEAGDADSSSGQAGKGELPEGRLAAGGLEALQEGEEEGDEEQEQEAGEVVVVGESEQPAAEPAAAAAAGRPPRPPATAEQRAEQQQQQQEQQEAAAQPQQAAGAGISEGGSAGSSASRGWVWRTRLEQSAPHWEGWYTGLSDMFLQLRVPKVLVLVGTDRLDRPLTIGQMQGKFQPVLLPQAGHAVHEDEPDRTADAIATFISRFRIGEPPLQIPRPVPGIRPVLPVAMGPSFAAHTPAAGEASPRE